MSTDMCMEMSIDMWIGTCTNMCIDLCIDGRHWALDKNDDEADQLPDGDNLFDLVQSAEARPSQCCNLVHISRTCATRAN